MPKIEIGSWVILATSRNPQPMHVIAMMHKMLTCHWTDPQFKVKRQVELHIDHVLPCPPELIPKEALR